MRVARYLASAALLGCGWFPILLVPSWTRGWLLSSPRWIAGNVVLLAASSMVLAWLFRGVIAGARARSEHVRNALLLPYAGCVIYLTLWNAATWIEGLARGGSTNLHDSLVLYPWGLGYAMAACFVVVPYGYLCQVLMSRAAEPAASSRDRAPRGAVN